MDLSITPALHPNASRSGDNAYYLGQCEEVGHRPNYAVCLNKIEQRKEGRLPNTWAECSAAIGSRKCPALNLRREELTEKRAIYFMSRAEIQALAAERDALSVERLERLLETGKVSTRKRNYASEDFQPVVRPAPVMPKLHAPVAPLPRARKEIDEIAASGGYAEAITRAASAPRVIEEVMPPKLAEASKVVPASQPVTVQVPVTPAPGERLTPLQLARLKIQK